MRKLFLFFAVFCAISCKQNIILEKPFIIISEDFTYHGDYFNYVYRFQDKNGNIGNFSSNKDNWNVGDKIE